MRVAIQGEPGSNSHLAVDSMLGPQDLLPCTLSAQVFERLTNGDADAAVLPIENSLHGAVADHDDLLLEHDVTIVGEMALRIRHVLIGTRGSSLDGVRRVLSHPVALSQCRRFFLQHASLRGEPFYDTAGAVRHVVQQNDPSIAAIAAPVAADVYGGTVLRRDLEDDPNNFTRFLLLARQAEAERLCRDAGLSLSTDDKVSLAFTIPHQPGSLVQVLQLLHTAGADLTRIESRPVPGRPWEYVFFVDLRLGASASAQETLTLLHSMCTAVRLLGRYGTVERRQGESRSVAEATSGR